MQFIERYFLTLLLFCGMAGHSLHAADQDSSQYTFKVSKNFMYGTGGAILAGVGISVYDWFLPKKILSEIPIPPSLQSKNIKVKQLHSYTQPGGACGWYALFNALALQELVAQGQEITALAIEKIVKERWIPYVIANHGILAQIINQQSLFTGDLFQSDSPLNELQMIALAEHANLRDYYVLRINEYGYRFCTGPERTIAGKQLKANWFYQILNVKDASAKFKEDKAIIKHIFLGVPSKINESHFVLVTLINRPGEKPIIIYMDSVNIPLDQCTIDYVVPFFVQKIINSLIEA